MPKTNGEKVDECVEIIGKGVFNKWEIDFLRDMQRRLQDPGFKLSLPRQRKLDEIYQKACDSPY